VPRYRFKAVRPDGEMEEGEREAADEGALVAALQGEGLIPLEMRAAGGLRDLFRRGGPTVSAGQVTHITRELATLLEAGLPLDRALEVLIGLADDEAVARLLGAVQERVRAGAAFSQALEEQGRIFSRLYVNMVRAGEAGGSLDDALASLADYLERADRLRDDIRSALTYPLILLVVAGLSVAVLLMFVVPQFTQLFDDMGAALPTSTRIVIGAGDLLRDWWWALLAGAALAAAGVQRALQRPEVRLAWDRRVLRLPLFGDLLWRMETARFCHTLATLLRNGMPLLGALGLAREVMGNRYLVQALEATGAEVRHGKGLAAPLSERRVLPKLALQMIQVGEESGQLDAMLAKVAAIFEAETRSAVQRLLTLLEPVLIIGLGLLVAGIIVSILAAILGANDLVF